MTPSFALNVILPMLKPSLFSIGVPFWSNTTSSLSLSKSAYPALIELYGIDTKIFANLLSGTRSEIVLAKTIEVWL